MRVGIIAEGPADQAVITHLVAGTLGLESVQIRRLRPSDTMDETDLHNRPPKTYSNWEIVRQECIDRRRIQEFLDSPVIFDGEDDRRLIVVQIDTAECHLYEVERPDRKSKGSSVRLLDLVRSKMAGWLGGDLANILRAVTVEETDAWLLALYADIDTTLRLDAKGAFRSYAFKNLTLNGEPTPRHYSEWSRPFRKAKDRARARKHNHSLDLFLTELEPFATDGS